MWLLLGKGALLALFFVLAHTQVPSWVADDGYNGGAFRFFTLWILSVTSVALIALHPKLWLRAVFAVLFTWSAGNALSYLYITGFALNAIEIERLFQDIAFIDETFEFYGALILKGSLISSLLFIGILLPSPTFSTKTTRRLLWAPLLVFIPIFGVAQVVYQDGGGDSDSLPLPISPLGFVGVLAFDELVNNPHVEREPIKVTTSNSSLDKIVVIMDESVRGDWLDLNTPNGIPTHLLSQLQRGANFGLIASFANCSAASNLSFRYAARRASFLTDIKMRPSLWALAKHAGYKTIYLDGQRTNRELQNFMTAQELSEIDELVQHDDNTVAKDKDMVLVTQLQQVLQQKGKAFIYVNKNGVHFPYENKYPASARLYTPHMEGTGINVNEGNQYGDGFGNEAFINSYRNAVAWNTGEFFKRLMPSLDLHKSVIIYTSDHGQSFTKTAESGFLTHCTTGNAPPSEGTVPLVLLTEQTQWLASIKKAAKYPSVASHWNVPPTVLLMMGYPQQYVQEHYEPSLLDAERGRAEFISTFFVRFGLEPVWNAPVKNVSP